MNEYPAWVRVKEKFVERYLNLYPNLTGKEIDTECENFYDSLVREGPINETTRNYNVYLRGWLARADFERKE